MDDKLLPIKALMLRAVGRNKPVSGRFRQELNPASAAYLGGNARRGGFIPA